MKVLEIVTGFDIGYNGGITNYVRNLAEELVEKGIEVYVLDSQNGEESIYKFSRIKLQNLELHPFGKLKNNYFKNKDSYKVKNILEEIKPDLIHIHMMLDLPLEVYEICQNYTTTIITLHDYSIICNKISLVNNKNNNCSNSDKGKKCFKCIYGKSNRVKYIIKKIFYDKYYERNEKLINIFKKFDTVIAVSTRVKEIYESFGYRNNNFLVNTIGNYTAKSDFREKFKNRSFNKKNLKLGFIGNFIQIKGADLILSLASRIKNNIVIYGRMDFNYKRKIQKIENIKYLGEYKQKELDKILADIDIGLVLPIWEDNAPQVVMEMMNAGIPVIGTNMGGIPDFIKNDYNGKIISPDIKGIEEIVEFINKKNLIEILIKFNLNLKNGTKTPAKHVEEIKNIYLKSIEARNERI